MTDYRWVRDVTGFNQIQEHKANKSNKADSTTPQYLTIF